MKGQLCNVKRLRRTAGEELVYPSAAQRKRVGYRPATDRVTHTVITCRHLAFISIID